MTLIAYEFSCCWVRQRGTQRLTKDEPYRIARGITRLPELPTKGRAANTSLMQSEHLAVRTGAREDALRMIR
jgi:hypothetical protein